MPKTEKERMLTVLQFYSGFQNVPSIGNIALSADSLWTTPLDCPSVRDILVFEMVEVFLPLGIGRMDKCYVPDISLFQIVNFFGNKVSSNEVRSPQFSSE
jgi:hypothetical protein